LKGNKLSYGVAVLDKRLLWHRFDSIHEAKLNAMWGTYGKYGVRHCHGTCPIHQLCHVRLVDCNNSHLLAILATQPQIYSTKYPDIIDSILEDRGFSIQQINDAVEAIKSV
jgi:hypothetical protein